MALLRVNSGQSLAVPWPSFTKSGQLQAGPDMRLAGLAQAPSVTTMLGIADERGGGEWAPGVSV